MITIATQSIIPTSQFPNVKILNNIREYNPQKDDGQSMIIIPVEAEDPWGFNKPKPWTKQYSLNAIANTKSKVIKYANGIRTVLGKTISYLSSKRDSFREHTYTDEPVCTSRSAQPNGYELMNLAPTITFKPTITTQSNSQTKLDDIVTDSYNNEFTLRPKISNYQAMFESQLIGAMLDDGTLIKGIKQNQTKTIYKYDQKALEDFAEYYGISKSYARKKIRKVALEKSYLQN